MGREFKKATVQDFEKILISLHCIEIQFTASAGLGVARAAALGVNNNDLFQEIHYSLP